MKKILLLGLSGLATLSAVAYSGAGVYPDATFSYVSPNGQYVVGDYYGTLTIFDRNTDAPVIIEADDDYEYITGSGNRVSDNGIILCNRNPTSMKPTYYYDGTWYELSAPEGGWSGAQLHGITPDGSRIVGCVDASRLESGEYLSWQSPAYWDLQEDGTYGEYQILPCPKYDLFGDAPQYITATYVSDNGKIVAGQIIDRTGMCIQPIVYTQDADGNWSYNLPLGSYFDVSEMPEKPGEEPELLTAQGLLTKEQLDEYNADLADWKESGNQGTKPAYRDYLNDDQKAMLEASEAEYAVWEEAQLAYEDFKYNLPRFAMNDIRMSPNGMYITTNMEYAVSRFEIIYTPVIVNIETGDLEMVVTDNEECGLIATQVFDDGSILAFNTMNALVPAGYYCKNEQCTPIYDYICNAAPEAKTWAEENLKHDIVDYDPELDEDVTKSIICTGLTVASADMSVIAVSANSEYWGQKRSQYGYLVDLSEQSGVDAIAVSESNIGFDANCALILGEDVVAVKVYDLSGRLLATDVETASNLSTGLYIVNAVYADGSVSTAKVCK